MLLLYQLQASSLHATVDGQLRTYTVQIAQSHTRSGWPTPLPGLSLDSNAEAQVIGSGGVVLAASKNLVGLPAIYRLPPGSATPIRLKAADKVVPTDIRVVAQRTRVGGQPVTIVTGTGTGLLRATNEAFLRHLAIGCPIILLLSAGVVWIVVGRALRPVSRIRTAVTAITAADLTQRVPEPGTNDEIGRLAHTMNDMLARLDDSARTQRRFVADASHELRSPLAAIRTTLEVGLAHPGTAPWPLIAQRAATQSERLERLLQQLLLLARADENAHAPGSVDLGAVLHELRSDLTSGTGRTLELHLHPDTVVNGIRQDLHRLLRNLIENALRHARSQVTVTVSPSPDAIVVTVDDDGPGIPPAERERVFDRFVRLDSSRDRGSGGSGLGLAIARDIAHNHYGSISITTSPAAGTRVTLHLPTADAPPVGTA